MWNGPTFQTYYSQIDALVRKMLDEESPEYLAQVDFNDYLEHLVRTLAWQRLEIDVGAMTAERITRRVTRRDDFSERTFNVDEPAIRLRFPCSAHPQRDEFLKYGPSTIWLSGEPKWRFESGALVYDVDATEQAIQKAKEAVEFWIGGRNRDIETGNSQLGERARVVWKERRDRLVAHRGEADALLNRLNIPLHQDPEAAHKPVTMARREIRTAIAKPSAPPSNVPALDHEDVVELIDFVEAYARQFEVTPRVYAGLQEEELRDLLLGMINANYPGTASGETFSKLGKTDIHLRVASGEVLIFECKFWTGAKAYEAAITQLFGYLTWRQNYGVLVHFCKLKDMTKAVNEAQARIGANSTCSEGSLRHVSSTRFVSRHAHPQDADKLVEIHHLFFDLSI